MDNIIVLTRRINHQKQAIARIGNHQIVQNGAIIIGKGGITRPAGFEDGDITGHKLFQLGHSVFTGQAHLPHMRHIKKTSLGTGMKMFALNTQRILNRHVISGKRHHFGTQFDMKVIKGRFKQFGLMISHQGLRDSRCET